MYLHFIYTIFTFTINYIKLDLIYITYLSYCNRRHHNQQCFSTFIRNHLQIEHNCTQFNTISTNAGEDPIDILNDILELKTTTGIFEINITYKALIFSQLFEVPLKRGVPFLYTLAELTVLKNRTHSFVCFRDEGNIT